jgi:3-hydroxybutyryl-CoA dehydrogenase
LEINRLAVVGAGIMGHGIAQVAAQAGLGVFLHDAEPQFLKRGLEKIEARLQRDVEKGRISEGDRSAALDNLKAVDKLEDLVEADFIVEAVSEDFGVKRDLFSKLDEICAAQAILASNTSSISITKIAGTTKRSEKVIGMHFFNPPQVLPLIEAVCGTKTGEDTYRITAALGEKMGKTVIRVNDSPGFVVNRMLIPMINEAIFTLMEGVASRDAIDTAMKLGTNHPLGPLSLADVIGLDTCLAIMRTLHEDLNDPKYRPCPLLIRMVDEGHLGRKVGKGFYEYE